MLIAPACRKHLFPVPEGQRLGESILMELWRKSGDNSLWRGALNIFYLSTIVWKTLLLVVLSDKSAVTVSRFWAEFHRTLFARIPVKRHFSAMEKCDYKVEPVSKTHDLRVKQPYSSFNIVATRVYVKTECTQRFESTLNHANNVRANKLIVLMIMSSDWIRPKYERAARES